MCFDWNLTDTGDDRKEQQFNDFKSCVVHGLHQLVLDNMAMQQDWEQRSRL